MATTKGKGKAEPVKKAEELFPESDQPAAEEEEGGAEQFDRDTSEAKSLADLAGTGGGTFEGPLVKMESIKGKKHIVLDFRMMQSTFQEGMYACIQIKIGGVLQVVNTNAKVILKGLNATDKSKLPQPNAFVMRKGKGDGKPYWDFASTEELAKLK
jgi:hypothetical protein